MPYGWQSPARGRVRARLGTKTVHVVAQSWMLSGCRPAPVPAVLGRAGEVRRGYSAASSLMLETSTSVVQKASSSACHGQEARSVAMELPHSGTFRASGCGCARSGAPVPGFGQGDPDASSLITRMWCACRGRQAASVHRLGGGLITRSTLVEHGKVTVCNQTGDLDKASRARSSPSSRSRSRRAGQSSPKTRASAKFPRQVPHRSAHAAARERLDVLGDGDPRASVGSGCCSPEREDRRQDACPDV